MKVMGIMRAEVHPGVAGLSGGKKQFWLRCNRKEVENFYGAFGPDDTLIRFNLKQDTLQRFFERQVRDLRLNKLSEADRWVMRVCNEGIRECKRRLADLEDWQAKVEPVIQVGQGIIATLNQLQSESQQLPPKTDTLRLADLAGKSKK